MRGEKSHDVVTSLGGDERKSYTDGQEQTTTEWSQCITWSKLAEIAAQYLSKGSRVYVAGRLHTARWEDVQTGERRSSVEIVVDDLILLDRLMPTANQEDEQDAREAQPSRPVPAPQSTTQHPIRRSTQSIQLRDTPATAGAGGLTAGMWARLGLGSAMRQPGRVPRWCERRVATHDTPNTLNGCDC